MNQNNRTVVSLPSDREVLITRVFDAPRDLVFKAMTTPELIPQWWGPRSTTTIVEKMDVRPGGAWRFVHRGDDGSEYGFRGEFREIVPHERVVQTFEYDGTPGHISVETMTLEEHDGKTTLTVRDVFSNREDRDAMIASGMEEGLNESYDRLAALLAEQSAAAR